MVENDTNGILPEPDGISEREDWPAAEVILRQTEVLKALAHPSRLRIVYLLRDRRRCVCELAAAVGCDISTISRHLLQLRYAGIISDSKEGNKVFHALCCPCLPASLHCLEEIVRNRVSGRV